MQPTHKYARNDACGPHRYKKLCLGNKYGGTIHAINSALVKLGRVSTATKVYRGVGGFRLPEAFLSPDEFGVRGGVEFGFMSATVDRQVGWAV